MEFGPSSRQLERDRQSNDGKGKVQKEREKGKVQVKKDWAAVWKKATLEKEKAKKDIATLEKEKEKRAKGKEKAKAKPEQKKKWNMSGKKFKERLKKVSTQVCNKAGEEPIGTSGGRIGP